MSKSRGKRIIESRKAEISKRKHLLHTANRDIEKHKKTLDTLKKENHNLKAKLAGAEVEAKEWRKLAVKYKEMHAVAEVHVCKGNCHINVFEEP